MKTQLDRMLRRTPSLAPPNRYQMPGVVILFPRDKRVRRQRRELAIALGMIAVSVIALAVIVGVL